MESHSGAAHNNNKGTTTTTTKGNATFAATADKRAHSYFSTGPARAQQQQQQQETHSICIRPSASFWDSIRTQPTGVVVAAAMTPATQQQCAHCGAKETSVWRKGPTDAGLLCNACGLYVSLNRVSPLSPLSLLSLLPQHIRLLGYLSLEVRMCTVAQTGTCVREPNILLVQPAGHPYSA